MKILYTLLVLFICLFFSQVSANYGSCNTTGSDVKKYYKNNSSCISALFSCKNKTYTWGLQFSPTPPKPSLSAKLYNDELACNQSGDININLSKQSIPSDGGFIHITVSGGGLTKNNTQGCLAVILHPNNPKAVNPNLCNDRANYRTLGTNGWTYANGSWNYTLKSTPATFPTGTKFKVYVRNKGTGKQQPSKPVYITGSISSSTSSNNQSYSNISNTLIDIIDVGDGKNPYVKKVPSKYKPKLDSFVSKVKAKRLSLGEAKYSKLINKINNILSQAKNKSPNNTSLLNIIGYLAYELNNQGDENDPAMSLLNLIEKTVNTVIVTPTSACGATPANVIEKTTNWASNTKFQTSDLNGLANTISYKFKTGNNPNWSGQLRFAAVAPSNSQQRDIWISTCPGKTLAQEPPGSSLENYYCGGRVITENGQISVTQHPTIRTTYLDCKLGTEKEYYLNVKNVTCAIGFPCDIKIAKNGIYEQSVSD